MSLHQPVIKLAKLVHKKPEINSFDKVSEMGSKKGVARGSYKTNRLKQHGDVFCFYCDKKYKKKSSLLQHIRAKHLKTRKICRICNSEFVNNASLNRHRKRLHTSAIQLKHLQTSVKNDETAQKWFIQNNENFGTHLIAASNIKSGEVVINVTPFAEIEYLVCTGEGCFKCGKKPKHKMYCSYCFEVFFCSSKCKASKLHSKKCDESYSSDFCRASRLITKMILVALEEFKDIEAMLKFWHAYLSNKNPTEIQTQCEHLSRYREIIELKGKVVTDHPKIARNVVGFILHRLGLTKSNTDLSKLEKIERMLFHLSYNHANAIVLNAFTEQITCTKSGSYVRYYIFDVLSRLNHSCEPNLEAYLNDEDATVCVAAREITVGEQLFISYFGNIQFESALERKKYLSEGWEFDCKCSKCVSADVQ